MLGRYNALDQLLDVEGSRTKNAAKTLADESAGLGQIRPGQTGATASVIAVSGLVATIAGLTGMTSQAVGDFLTLSGAASAGNNNTHLIVEFVSSVSVKVINSTAVAGDANNGAILWAQRDAYSLEDDLNFTRTDRAAIKGVSYDTAVAPYQRPTAVGTDVPTNLTNVSGKTTDAKALTENRRFEDAVVAATNTFITITSIGNLKHATASDRTGVPVQDGADTANLAACYVEVLDASTGQNLVVLGGANVGQRIYGFTEAGASISPDSVRVRFYSISSGTPISTANPYAWEVGQPLLIDLFYGFRETVDDLNDTVLRTILVNGGSGGGFSVQQHEDLDTLVHSLSETHEQIPTFNADGVITSTVAQGVGGGTLIRNMDLMTADADGLITGARVQQRDFGGSVIATLTSVVTIVGAVPTKNVVTKT